MGTKAPARGVGICHALAAAILFSASAHAREPFCFLSAEVEKSPISCYLNKTRDFLKERQTEWIFENF